MVRVNLTTISVHPTKATQNIYTDPPVFPNHYVSHTCNLMRSNLPCSKKCPVRYASRTIKNNETDRMTSSYNHRQEQDHLKLLLIRTGKTKGGCIVRCPQSSTPCTPVCNDPETMCGDPRRAFQKVTLRVTRLYVPGTLDVVICHCQ